MHIAVTGCIGSGKSYVCRLIERRGVKVYDCDREAKRLLLASEELQKSVSSAVGRDVFHGGAAGKALLAQFIVASERNARMIDAIVHPAVARHFLRSGYEWVESAILFESGFDKRIGIDYAVCVTARLETRIGRIMERDRLTREEALGWINRQMSQEEKVELSDFEIVNDGGAAIDSQIDRLMEDINRKLYTGRKRKL